MLNDPSLCFERYNGESASLRPASPFFSLLQESGANPFILTVASMLGIIGNRLKKKGIPFYLLTGSTTKEERNKMVNAFSPRSGAGILISPEGRRDGT